MIKSNLIHARILESLAKNEEIFSFLAIVFLFNFKKIPLQYRHRNLLVKFYYKIKQPAPSNPRCCCWNRDLSVLYVTGLIEISVTLQNGFFKKKLICNLQIIPSKLLDRVLCYDLNLYFLYHLASGLNSNTTKVQTNVMSKSDNTNTIITSVALLL